MTGVREIVIGLIGAVLILVVTACGPATATAVLPASDSQAVLVSTPATAPAATHVVWGKVPYCNCFATSATGNVADALKAAHLTVSLQELSPRDGWLYFAVTFDPQSTTMAQVGEAMVAGGAELLDGPP